MTVPYYAADGITIYNARCEDVLPSIEPASVALVLTDPPYGMDYKPSRCKAGERMWDREVRVEGDGEPFDPAHLLHFPRLVLFGANWYADRLPTSGGWVVWDKTPGGVREGFYYSHCELAWTNLAGRILKFSMEWQGNSRNGEPFLHPTQKPVALMRWLLTEYTQEGDLVLDPYMGSGPVAQACLELNRRYIGCEVSAEYCTAAVTRLSQQFFDLGGVA